MQQIHQVVWLRENLLVGVDPSEFSVSLYVPVKREARVTIIIDQPICIFQFQFNFVRELERFMAFKIRFLANLFAISILALLP